MKIKKLDDFVETVTSTSELEWRESANGQLSIVLAKNGRVVETLASEDPMDKLRLAGFFMEIALFCSKFNGNPHIGVIGAGTCVLPRALAIRPWKGKIDIYEKEPSIITELKTNPRYADYLHIWNFIEGAYADSITGIYDILVYDIAEEPDLGLLNSHLAEGGLLLGAS